MKSLFKSPEAVEFLDLMREMRERFGYNQNRIAEIAELSPSMITQIVQGKRSPGRPSLTLLRRHLQDLTEPKAETANMTPDELRDQLAHLKEHDPSKFESARRVVDTLYKQSVETPAYSVIEHQKKPAVNSAAASAQVRKAAAVAKHALRGNAGSGESERRREAGEHTSRKDQPSKASRHQTKPPPPAHGEEGKR